MPIHEIALPVGAKNIDPPLSTITRSSKDGSIPIVQVFGGDNFVGEVLEGHWGKTTSNGIGMAKLISGQLRLSAYADSGPCTWISSDVGIPILQDGYIDIHMEGHGSVPAASVYFKFYITGGVPAGNPDSEDYTLQGYLMTQITTGDTYICVGKVVDGSPITIYSETAITNDEGTFRIKFDPDNDKIAVFFHDGTGDVDESTDELTLTSDSDDMFLLNIQNLTLHYWCGNTNEHYAYSNGVQASYPDTAVSYEQDAADVGKGDVKCYDAMGSVTESDWRRIYSEDHDFTGDCVIENGLIRLIIDEAAQNGLKLYYWTGSAWAQPLDFIKLYQNEDAKTLTYPFLKQLLSMNRAEEIQLRVRLCEGATESDFLNTELLITLSRGKYHLVIEIDSVLPVQRMRVQYGNTSPLRWSFCGDVMTKDIGDDNLSTTVSNNTMSDNFMVEFDDAGSAVLGILSTNQKPALEVAAFYSYQGDYVSLHSIAEVDFPITEIYVGLIPYAEISSLFIEAEDGTLSGTAAIVADGLASAGYMVELDGLSEYVYHELVGVTNIPLGRYVLIARVKDTAQVADDLEMSVYNSNDMTFCNEEGAEAKKTVTGTYALYQIVFDIQSNDSGDTIEFYTQKGTATTNTIKVDYLLIIPITDGESYLQDIAHNAVREAAVNFRLTDSATFQLFSGLGLTGQLAGSVYTDAMAINAIETAASISLSGPFTASTIKTGADNEGIYVGAGNDLRVYHDGTNTYIRNATGILYIKSIGNDIVTESVDFTTDIGGVYRVRDSDDSDVVLMELDTNARTLQFGQAADKLTADLYGDLTISDYLTVNTINHALSDPDVFLVSDGGEVKYRTGSELASDIGAVSVPLALTDLASYVQGSIIIGGSVDWEALAAGTETHVLTMGASEPYWAAAGVGSHDFDTHTGDLDLTDLGSYVQGSIIISGNADWEALAAGTLNYVLKMGAAEPAWGQVDYSELVGTQPGPIAHQLDSIAYHTVSGLTVGHFLKALTATTFGFAAHGLGASDVGAYTIAQVDSAIDADISTHNVADNHIAHSGVTITAGTGLSGGGTIAASRTINCDITQYTNAMAVSAVQAANPLNLTYGLTVGGDIQVNGGDVNIGNSGSIPGYLSLGTGGVTNPQIKRDATAILTLQSGGLKVEGYITMATNQVINTYDISPISNNTEYVGTSTSDKYLAMYATSFNTGDVVFGNKWVLSEVVQPSWNGDRNARYEDWFAQTKADGATPGLIFHNGRGEPVALLDEDGDLHIRGRIYEFSQIFK